MKRTYFGVLLAMLLAAAILVTKRPAFLVYCYAWTVVSHDSWKTGRLLSGALRGARTVTLVEFVRTGGAGGRLPPEILSRLERGEAVPLDEMPAAVFEREFNRVGEEASDDLLEPIVLARKEATPEEISRLREATKRWFEFFSPSPFLCYEPHHTD